MKCRPILVDDSLRELTQHGTRDFPLSMDRQAVLGRPLHEVYIRSTLDRILETEQPAYNVPMNYLSGGLDIAKAYAHLGNKAKATETLKAIFDNSHQYMKWYNSLTGSRFTQAQQDCIMHIFIMNMCVDTADTFDKTLANKFNQLFTADVTTYHNKGGVMPQ